MAPGSRPAYGNRVDLALLRRNRARPGLREALAACRTGDTLVVSKLDRLARSVPDARDLVHELVTCVVETDGWTAASTGTHDRREAATHPRPVVTTREVLVYRSIVAGTVRSVFESINHGDPTPMVNGLGSPFRYEFHGDHALGGIRTTRQG